MRKRWEIVLYIALVASILLVSGSPSYAQNWRKERKKAKIEQPANAEEEGPRVVASKSQWMGYKIEDGDTVYYANLQPVWVFALADKTAQKNYRNYYKLVYNFNKVYPYALMARRLEEIADSTMAANHFNKKEEEAYLSSLQKELLAQFTGVVKNMSISQGALLIRLVDREVGRTTYKVIKDYRSGISATFWQGIAKLFGQNLKNRYDPNGADKVTEELVQKWESGEFNELYYSIFFTYPKKTEIPSKYR